MLVLMTYHWPTSCHDKGCSSTSGPQVRKMGIIWHWCMVRGVIMWMAYEFPQKSNMGLHVNFCKFVS